MMPIHCPTETRHPTLRLAAVLIAPLLLASQASAAPPVETIVVVRHAEKPPLGLGLLTCKGLNRSLLLPEYFAKNFPKPDYIFAPDPSVKATEIHGDGERYDYVRPLLTIGPTAVRFGVPMNTQLPFNDPGLLADVLLAPEYANATVYVAWEHSNIVTLAEIILRRFEVTTPVPDWPNSDYDKVFVFKVTGGDKRKVDLVVAHAGIGELSDHCPTAWPQ